MKKLFVVLCLVFLLLLILFPSDSADAAKQGLDIFLYTVLPSLLPFFIVSSLLLATGVFRLAAKWMEPLMRPLFHCPGHTAYVFLLSITSGYPVGAKLTATLVKSGNMTPEEGLRTLCFCSTSGPVFMVGAVAVGMLGVPQAGVLLALAHYLSALAVGVLGRFLIPDRAGGYSKSPAPEQSQALPIGTIMREAITGSIQTLLTVGGYIILFCVLIRFLTITGVLRLLGYAVTPLLLLLGMPQSLATPFAAGLIEMTTGAKLISLASAPLAQKTAAIAGVISWSGFGIHSQATAFLSDTPISIGKYMGFKALHGLIAICFCLLLSPLFPQLEPAATTLQTGASLITQALSTSALLLATAAGFFLFLLGISLVIWITKKRPSSNRKTA